VNLAEKLTQPPARERVVGECCTVIDEEVASKGGLSGIAVKGSYKIVKAVKPKFIPEVVNDMLDEWVGKLEPFFATWQASGDGKAFPDFLASRGGEVAEALLEVTDKRARGAKNKTVKSMYEKMRPTAKKHVEEALPRLGRLVERNAR
jgi:hypothetical protein